jgi:hypothetical protein
LEQSASQCAAKDFCRDPQARTALLLVKCTREFKDGTRGDDVVVGNAKLGFPAGANAFHMCFEFAGSAQDMAAFIQQLATGSSELGAR